MKALLAQRICSGLQLGPAAGASCYAWPRYPGLWADALNPHLCFLALSSHSFLLPPESGAHIKAEGLYLPAKHNRMRLAHSLKQRVPLLCMKE